MGGRTARSGASLQGPIEFYTVSLRGTLLIDGIAPYLGRRSMSLQRTKERLVSLLGQVDNRVIALSGKWGTGKTHLWNEVKNHRMTKRLGRPSTCRCLAFRASIRLSVS